MSSEFDWFMVTMPIFAIVVYLIVMIGSMEKQPKFLESEGVKKLTGLVFVGLFGGHSDLFLLHDPSLHRFVRKLLIHLCQSTSLPAWIALRILSNW